MGRRRSVVFVVACGLPFGVAAATATLYFPMTFRTVEAHRGQEIFEQRCMGCHEVSGAGGARMGPSLVKVGSLAATRREGYSTTDYMFEALLDPAAFRASGVEGHMPRNIVEDLEDRDVRNLVAYLTGLGGTPDYRAILQASVDRLGRADGGGRSPSLRDIEQGRAIFEGKGQCSTCHLLIDDPGYDLRAPSLLNAGAYDRQYLLESILDPARVLAGGYRQWTVITNRGEIIAGRILRETENEVVVFDVEPSGKAGPKWISRDDIVSLSESPGSLMPSSEGVLTSEEISFLLVFLSTLKS